MKIYKISNFKKKSTDNCESISELQILTAKISSTKQVRSWRWLKIFMAGQTSVCILMQIKKKS